MLKVKEVTFSNTIRLKYESSYMDGGTKSFKVLNPEDCGLFRVYQDYRLGHEETHGAFFTRYPNEDGAVIINTSCILKE